MKKVITIIGLLALITALLCVSAFAAEGVTNVNANTGYTLTVQNAEGAAATLSGDVYTDAAKFALSYTGAEAGSFQLVYMIQGESTALPTESNLYYIDLATTTDGNVNFVLFPKTLTEGTYAIIRTDNKGTNAVVGTLEYTLGTASFIPGDANLDTYVNIDDVTDVLTHIVNPFLTGDNYAAADINGDTFVNIDDITDLLTYIVTH